jgi:hypothetical protein
MKQIHYFSTNNFKINPYTHDRFYPTMKSMQCKASGGWSWVMKSMNRLFTHFFNKVAKVLHNLQRGDGKPCPQAPFKLKTSPLFLDDSYCWQWYNGTCYIPKQADLATTCLAFSSLKNSIEIFYKFYTP